ncbi:alpha-L-fucosidase [Streptomyces sp. ADMS]|uniref:alpha-L-fucosidase n=1 Tax=Streptomyces sp. ADMS TaxID=3071415 RepID=UPI00296E7BD1|nr:alpha-L-fucosidase [Streptomyces sp. ADMS]MDW4904225.1 alpha-L-fucosidase [Streptomyces sp. ADMS]
MSAADRGTTRCGGRQNQVTAGFAPSSFNAATIAELARNAGMKYLVITAKHHEGYAMWDSNVPGFTDVTGTKLYNLRDYKNFQPDLLAQLKTECESRGIRFGLYYSILDWSHPSQTIDRGNYFSDMSSLSARTAYINDMKAQLQELLNRYDPAVLWFDGGWCGNPSTPDLDDWWTQADGADLYNWLLARKPDLIVNERVKRDHGLGDYAVAEFGIPDAPLERPWEACATMNDAWGYNEWKENQYRSVQTLVREMATVVSRDGNYLLNIGPRGDGTLTAGTVTVLNGMGSWMATHGDSIHGTSGSPFVTEPSWGRVTKKNGKLFAHVFNWPTGGTLQIPAVYNTINRVYLMNNPGTNLNYWVSGGQINVQVPTTAPNANDSVVCVEVNGMPAVLANGVYGLVCAQSGKALDNGNTADEGSQIIQWTPNGGAPQQWAVTDLGHGYYRLVCARSGKAPDDNGGTGDGGVMVQRTVSNTSYQQQWAITALGGGAHRLINRHSGKALDNSNNAADWTRTIQWTPNGGPQQQWNTTKVG